MKHLVWAACLAAAGTPAIAQTVTDTTSDGEIYTEEYYSDGRRNDSYQTRLWGEIDGEVVFDETFYRSIDDATVRDFLSGMAAPRAWVVDGAPGVLTWSAPELLDQYEEILDIFTETTVSYGTTTVTTVQWTSGDDPDPVVLIGGRGYCYSLGSNGPTNYGDRTGAFADCDYWEEHYVNPGELNRNTHTTTIYSTIYTDFTNEDVLTVSDYRMRGQVRLIGMTHGAAQTAMFDGGSAFLDQMTGRSDGRQDDQSARMWADAYGGEASTGASGALAGSERDSRGVRAGMDWAAGPFTFGLGIDHGTTDAETVGQPEASELTLTQAGGRVGVAWSGGAFITATATAGWGEVDAWHGDSSIGGVSRADYGVSTFGGAVTAGYRARLAGWRVTPMIGFDHLTVRSDGFTETGGIALRAEEASSERGSLWTGLGFGRGLALGEDLMLDVEGRVRAYQLIGGEGRTLPVVMADLPDQPLTLRGAPEHESGVEYGLSLSLAMGERFSLFAGGERVDAGPDEASRWRAGLKVRW